MIRAELVKRNPQRYGEPTNAPAKMPEEYAKEVLELAKRGWVVKL